MRLEHVLGGGSGSPFTVAMDQARTTVEKLTWDVFGAYKVPLD